jgi:hypothetical protein
VHVIFVVTDKYKPDDLSWIQQPEWSKLWQKSKRTSKPPVVYVEFLDTTMVEGKLNDAARRSILQCTKYIVKPQELYYQLADGTWDGHDEIVEVLHDAAHGRRQLGWSGVLLQAGRELNQVDSEDLEDEGAEEERKIPPGYTSLRLETFKWRNRRQSFELIDTIELGCPLWEDVDQLIAEAFDTAPPLENSS